jgi:DNA-binding transcriptional regulator of glucitol operon
MELMISQLLKTWRETAFNRMQNLGFGLKSSHSANLNILLIAFVIQNYYQAVVLQLGHQAPALVLEC